MKIYHKEVADSKDLVRVFNDQLKDIPYFYHVSPKEFENEIVNRNNPSNPNADLQSEKIIVGEQDGKILGFAHVSIGELKNWGDPKKGGFIHFMTYKSGYRPIGQAILEECERYLKELGIEQIWVFMNSGNYCFYHLGFGYLSDKMAHIVGLFRMNKYETDIGEIFLSYPDYKVSKPILPDKQIKINIVKEDSKGTLPNLHVKASRNDNEIGECYSVSLGEFYRAKEAQDSFFTKWLGVNEEFQGKGLGKYLLQRMFWEMRKIGYKNAIISTNVKNYRAQLLYTNFGYKITDTSYALGKKFNEGDKNE